MRIKPNDLCMSDAMPFQQHHEARTTKPVEEVFDDKKSFLDVRGNLHVGDTVTICSYESISKNGDIMTDLQEFGSGRVVKIGLDEVVFQLSAPVVKVDAIVVPAPRIAEEPRMKVLRGFAGVFRVEDAEGNVIDQFKDKASATEFVEANSGG